MVVITLDNTLGAAFIGSTLTSILYGLTTVQTATYYTRNPGDLPIWKLTVGILWVLDTVHTALVAHIVYFYGVTHYGNVLIISKPIWSIGAQLFVATFMDSIIRGVFGYRIWKLSNRKHGISVVSILFILSAVTTGTGIAYGIKSYQVTGFEEFLNVEWLGCWGLVMIVLTDVAYAAVLWYLLSVRRSGNKKMAMDGVVQTLMLYAINTGGLVAVCAIGCLIAFVSAPNTFIYIAIYFILPKLLMNALLMTFNTRESLRDRMAQGGVIHLSGLSSAASDRPSAGHSSGGIRARTMEEGSVGSRAPKPPSGVLVISHETKGSEFEGEPF
ncbi:uncharacterized protein BXZ73DRAFT_104824 [Epithele typhae]|uniref:uncharacterized protein n=1 Tax=Epithele typhae TaxID=378194 RepID=UPI0020083AF7|nr:uncharacterized protein BXZ73DRAFT_104824 [Epithele typhae]KAH9920006.1 hypothetical protein BXZ73DRAFT_104824 [Epithele typhae]